MDVLMDEIESLEAILMDDVRIYRNSETGAPEIIETTIFPAVENISEEQYICVNLQVIPTIGYPEISPNFNLLKPRGLDDCRLDAIRLDCVKKLKETIGFPVVFDLIEVIREHLSGSNVPCGQCVVCLYGFKNGDAFTKTACYHYLHSYCLVRHLKAARKNYHEEQEKLPAWIRKASEPFKATCPVCREVIKDDSEILSTCLPPAELSNAPKFELTDELVSLQKKMSNLFVLQKEKGGIIDEEAEVGTVISIEPNDGATEEQSGIPHGVDSGYFFKEDRLPIDHKTPMKSGNSGEASFRKKRTSQEGIPNSTKKADANPSTNFAPVVAQYQRIASDPTNNNYHHQSNRRYFRGRRSHHQHHQRSENASHSLPASTSAGQIPCPLNCNKQKKVLPDCSPSAR